MRAPPSTSNQLHNSPTRHHPGQLQSATTTSTTQQSPAQLASWRTSRYRPSTGTPSYCTYDTTDSQGCLGIHPLTARHSYWILIPITIVMVLTGVLRHYASVLMATAPKKQDARAMREQRSLARGVSLRSNHHVLSRRSFEARRDHLTAGYESGAFLKEPEKKGQPPANPMTDPSAMDGMMGMMKNNMAMIIPNTLIMSWISAFFSGYVISACHAWDSLHVFPC